MSPRNPGQRAGLTRVRVVGAARDLLAESGALEALTMRALAARLEVSPNALYSHVSSKDGLVDEILDDVLAEVAAPADSGAPAAGLHALMVSTYEVLLAHPELVPLYLARQGARGPNAQRLGDVMLELLARAGVEGERAREALRVLIVYTIGFAAFATRAPVAEPGTTGTQLEENFHSGLRWLLMGIELGARGAGAPAPA